MSLNDDLIALEEARRNTGGTRCRVAVILDLLDVKERAALNHLIDETDVFGSQIAETLGKHGHSIKGQNIQHHRRRIKGGGCICPRPEETK